MNNALPIVAVVGQPNAGKSTLINKIAGKPLAITSDLAGTTRDRQYVDTLWNGVNFTLVDTAGLDARNQDELELSLQKQIEIALEEADIVLFVVDGKQPIAAATGSVLKKFRRTKKPLLLAVNKMDSPKTRDVTSLEFRKLGINPLFPTSSLSGLGLGDMLDYITDELKKLGLDKNVREENTGIAVSIVGKPNVGKSSIFNAILKEERVVVSPIAGTTRTAIDSSIKIDGENYTFIDTAGLKKKEFRQEKPDIFSGFQTFKSIRRSDVCFFVIDANEELTKQDQRVASEILNMQKGCIILANKSDLVKNPDPIKKGFKAKKAKAKGKSDDEYGSIRDYISHHFPFLWMCPLFFISAVTKKNLDEALAAIKPIYDARHKQIDDQVLYEYLQKKMKENPPKLLRDQKTPKVFTLKQLEINPPKFELLVNHPAAISMQFRKFLENGIVKDMGFWGTPINLRIRGKDKA